MVEIEIGVMVQGSASTGASRRPRLISEIAAWEHRRNAADARINWMFTTDKARAKMGRASQRHPAKGH